MRRHLASAKTIHAQTQHDIKLELDHRCQQVIERKLLAALPGSALLGEEGVAGDPESAWRWVVDPIDGTVNFTYGIPHSCVSIALQVRGGRVAGKRRASPVPGRPSGDTSPFLTVLGVVYDPFNDELWTATRGHPARLNGKIIHVSARRGLDRALISLGFGNTRASLEHTLRAFTTLAYQVRKLRLMGSAGLAMTYVACGRFDAFVEAGVRLWDIAAGGLILECAGGDFDHRPIAGEHVYEVNANNGRLRRRLARLVGAVA
jgi:myo-inositol-1(or 4)-monophosphatase